MGWTHRRTNTQSELQTTTCKTFGNRDHRLAWRLITCPTPTLFLPSESGRGTLLFLSCPYTHGSTVSESGLNSPRRRQRCPSSQTKTHSGWIVSHAQLSLRSHSLHRHTADRSGIIYSQRRGYPRILNKVHLNCVNTGWGEEGNKNLLRAC